MLKNLIHFPEFINDKRIRIIVLFMLGLSAISDVLAFFLNPIIGFLVLIIVIVITIIEYLMLNHLKLETDEYLYNLSYRLKRGRQDSLIRMPIGTLFFNKEYEIEWINPYLQHYFGKENLLGRSIKTVDKDLFDLIKNYDNNQKFKITKWRGYIFDLLVQKDIRVAYMMDVTQYINIQKKYEKSRIFIGQIFLDNFDEISKSMNDKEISNLINFVTSSLSDWSKKFDMFLKRIDEDHYIIIGYTGILDKLKLDKFDILNKVRERTFKSNSPITLSIGIAYGDDNLNNLTELSQSNLDLALGRGGDQVVVREMNGPANFYGGKTSPMAKRTRVRARMISQALSDLLRQSDQVFVMGHKHPDMDSMGSCLGICRIASMNNKKCWIVLDKEKLHSDIQRLLDQLDKYPEIKNSIISSSEAVSIANENSLLVMVDHSKPSITVSLDLYNKLSNRTVIIDHHRRGEEFPDNPILVYIESYASSTCELIAEMFEYQSRESDPITKIEATTMLTGIIVDTQSFSQRTGTRTFDAASYLLSMGANLSISRNLIKENENSYMQKNHLIDRTEFIGNIAICTGNDDKNYDPVIAAQAADSLLSITDIQASFVITRRNDNLIGISARSDGSINVQVIMEKMGGGGHLSNAATQLKNTDIQTAHNKLLSVMNYDIKHKSRN